MPKQLWSNENEPVLSDNDREDDVLLDVAGDWLTPDSLESFLKECGLTYKDYYSENYE